MHLSSLARALRACDLIRRSDRILVAVSGGADSVALLHVLHELRGELGLQLEVAHLQHGLRGDEAQEDAQYVAGLAEKLEVPFHLREIDVAQLKRAAGRGNLEALARAERYRFFAEVVRERNLHKAATGHTLDDQAETVLMWYLRGAGPRGMGGMAPVSEFDFTGHRLIVIRPFLEVSKAAIHQYLAARHLAYRDDSTNQDASLLRNWLRLRLLPELQRRLDSDLPARLARQASILRDEDAVLDELARQRFAAIARGEALDRQAFLRQAKALQRRILRIWIEQRRGHLRGLEFVHILDGLRLISEEAPQGRIALPGGWELVREYDRLTLARRIRGRAPCYQYPLTIGTMLSIPQAGLEFSSEPMAAPQDLPADCFEAVFDARALSGPLSVRNFRRGDRFQPLGMSGHKKIKDLFIEKRVPLSIRAHWPLLVCGEKILWIPGYARSAVAAVSEATTPVWRIVARPVEG